ncbi:MAG: flagellar basal-body rod protein FlgF, partial [Kofleriaceae bacterium]|nr:flagellar basal-body rod protein FlgF [Kofleriaceae bacterium]
MQSGLYVALSGQIALQRRIDTIAHNVANVSTAGFRAEEIKFETLVSQVPLEPTAFSTLGETYLSRRSGEFTRTDNPFDVAVNGDAWMAFQGPAGTVYTRDGRMRITPTGDLQTLNGYPVLDVGGAPITLNANGGPPVIAHDGMITQGGTQVGAIGLFSIAEDAKLSRFENSGVVPDRPAEPALDFSRVGVSQGYIERANVNAVMEMTQLVMMSRSFDAVTNS